MFWFNSDSNTNKEKPPRLGGGPHGYGDPDDLALRKIERDVLIPQKVQEEAKKKCAKEVRAFLDCVNGKGMSVIFHCKEENKMRTECLLKWVNDLDFKNEVTEMYLNERSYFRRTGQPLHSRFKPGS